MPVAFVKMERVWEGSNQAGLRYAQCVRLSSSALAEIYKLRKPLDMCKGNFVGDGEIEMMLLDNTCHAVSCKLNK